MLSFDRKGANEKDSTATAGRDLILRRGADA